MVRKDKYDLCIIDWMMPKLSGLDLVKIMRKEGNDAILIMLTAKDEEEDLIDAFEAGVDDYIRKPFSSRELMLRINVHLKRLKLKQTTTKNIGDVHLDLAKRSCMIKNESILLTKIEFDLLLYFTENLSQVLSRDMILNALWNFEYDGDTRIVDVHVFKLKAKMKSSLLEFKSIRGIGYQLEVNRE